MRVWSYGAPGRPGVPNSCAHRYPNAVKLLRSYGRFLEQVKNDPWTAARYFA